MTRFKGRPPVRGSISVQDPIETYTSLLEFEARAKDGWILATQLLYATLAFRDGSLPEDAREYARDILQHMPTDRLKFDVAGLLSTPSLEMAASLARACSDYVHTPAASREKPEVVEIVQDVLQRCELYAAAWGHLDSCYRAAGHAYTYSRIEENPVISTRYTAVATGLLSRAQAMHFGITESMPMTDPAWLEKALSDGRTSARQLGDYAAARTYVTLRKDGDPIAEMLSDVPEPNRAPDTEITSDLEALLTVAPRAWVIRHREQPTIVVVPSLDHLPQVKANNISNPRAEYGALAEKALPTAPVPDVRAAAAELRDEMPWAADAINAILMDLVGAPYARIRPTLLLARPGVGKTRFIRRLGQVIGLHTTIYPSSIMADGSFGGTSRQWGTGRACIPGTLIRQAGSATILVGLDEIDKAGTGTSAGRLTDSLVPFLERESASRFFDPYLEANLNLSAVSFLATCNDTTHLPGPLLDRFRIIEVGSPRREHLPRLARTILSEIRQEREEDALWTPDLDGGELDLLVRQWKGGSLRPLRRMVETVLAGRLAFAPRH